MINFEKNVLLKGGHKCFGDMYNYRVIPQFVCIHLANREVKIDVYGRPVTANAKLQVGFSGEVLAVRN